MAEEKTFGPLFAQAFEDLKAKKPKSVVIKKLASDLKMGGYPESKICSAIIKQFNVVDVSRGKKYADDDYIRRQLPASMKRQIAKQKKDPKKMITKAINDEIEIAKEKGIEVPVAIEIEAEETEIELGEDDSEVIVDAPVVVAVPSVDTKKLKEFEDKVDAMRDKVEIAIAQRDGAQDNFNRKSKEFEALRKDYDELLKKYNKVAKPYMERRWVIVKTNEENVCVEVDAVAIPETRRINIPQDTKNMNFSRPIPIEELQEHKQEWNKLTKGRKSRDIKIKSDTTTAKAEAS